jgi:hypothetical protein
MTRGPGEARRPRRGKQCRDIEVPLQVIGKPVQHIFDHRLVRDRAAFGAEPREKGAAEWVACEQPVQIAPHDPAVGADRAIGMAVEIEHRPLQA